MTIPTPHCATGSPRLPSSPNPTAYTWCTGSDIERDELIELMLGRGDLIELNQATFPNCYCTARIPRTWRASSTHVSSARHTRTTRARITTGWRPPRRTRRSTRCSPLHEGRTLYVVPYCMGPINSPYARCGVEITDSRTCAQHAHHDAQARRPCTASRRRHLRQGLHSIGDLNPDRRYIMHFPDELSIKSIGSGYGGNALLGKKCHALRIASHQARTEGWLAEHMLIVGSRTRAAKCTTCWAHSVGLRQDQPRMLIPPDTMRAGRCGPSAKTSRGCTSQRWPAARDQPRGGFLRRGAGHQPEDQPQRLRDDPPRHDLHQRSR